MIYALEVTCSYFWTVGTPQRLATRERLQARGNRQRLHVGHPTPIPFPSWG